MCCIPRRLPDVSLQGEAGRRLGPQQSPGPPFAGESAANVGGRAAAPRAGQIAVGVSNHTSFLHPTSAGRIVGAATAIQQGRTRQLRQAGLIDEASRLIATGQLRLQNAGPPT